MKNNQSAPQLLAPLAAGFVIGALALGTAVLIWNHGPDSRADSDPPAFRAVPSAPMTAATPGATSAPSMAAMPGMTDATPASAPALDPAVTRVAARFTCSCGTAACGAKALDLCSCDIAQKERAFIQEQLRAGRSEADAANALNQKYGGLKSGPL